MDLDKLMPEFKKKKKKKRHARLVKYTEGGQ